MPSAVKQYGYINAKLRTRISLILTDEFLDRLARASSLSEATALLADTPFASVHRAYSETGDIRYAEAELQRTEVALYREIVPAVEEEVGGVISALLMRFEIENLKSAMRIWFDRFVRKRDVTGAGALLIGENLGNDIRADEIIGSPDPESVSALLASTPYGALVGSKLPGSVSAGNLFEVDAALDEFFYRNLTAAIQDLGGKDRAIAGRIVGTEIDLQNLSKIIRLKTYQDLPYDRIARYIIPGGKNLSGEIIRTLYGSPDPVREVSGIVEGNYPGLSMMLRSAGVTDAASRLVLVERLLEEIMRHEVRKILLGPPFTVGIILAYFILKGRETASLITILNAKYYGMDDTQIKELL